PDTDETLTTQMKSVGEAMAIGRTFKEALQKCIRSMEIQRSGFGLDRNDVSLSRDRRQMDGGGPVAEAVPRRPVRIGGTRAAEAPPDTDEEHARDWPIPERVLEDKLGTPCQGRLYYIRYALKMGWSVERIHKLSGIDPWFLDQMKELVDEENELARVCEWETGKPADAVAALADPLGRAKRRGYSDVQLALAGRHRTEEIARVAERRRVRPVYKLVDTCAAEFEARTPYYYSTYEAGILRTNGKTVLSLDDEIRVSDRPKVVILGGGPNRIGQGIEFDYCCCHASFAAREAGYESVMINSNPETVSTDFDTSDMLFFEPLTHEHVLHIIERLDTGPLENGEPPARNGGTRGRVRGVIVQFGGQTPLNLAQGLKDAGVPILGTQPEMIHLAEDRDEFQKILRELSLLQPPHGIARSTEEAHAVARRIGYPVLVRPSYVLGGRGMRVCNNDDDLDDFLDEALGASDRRSGGDNPVLIDKFLADAIEVDVDAVADFGRDGGDRDGTCMVAGILEHIEEAGIHSGDSTCVLPPFSLGRMVIEELFHSTKRLARRLNVCGAINVQYAILNRTVYVLEVNPRASRTLPFISKATGVPWARIATRVMLGEPLAKVLAEHGVAETPWPKHTAVKAPVFPFDRFPGVDVILGPEMRSTGEVMAIAPTFGQAFAKAQIATGFSLPTSGNALVSVNDPDKPRIVSIARDLYDLGFTLYSTVGTRRVLAEAGIPATLVSKQSDTREAPFLLDLILDGTLDLLINTPIHTGPASAEGRWRAAAAVRRVPLITTLAGARAAVAAIKSLSRSEDGRDPRPLEARPLQDYFASARASVPERVS
ncbi:MAG: carbamoyl-phosphate synthase large subunit, partial [Planctomycetota bacterium]